MRKFTYRQNGNTWFSNQPTKTEYRNICLLADQDLHDRFLDLAKNTGLQIGQIITDETEKRAFCAVLNFEYIPVYSIITHK